MLTRQQKRYLLNAVKFVVPALFVFVLVVAALNARTIQAITHPPHTAYTVPDLEEYKLLGIPIQKTDESWSLKDGTAATGWLLHGPTGAPAIVLSHGYGQNQTDLLSLGVALQRSGYHVLLYDLRAHGKNTADFTSLGEYESDDLIAAINHLKELKDTDGSALIDKDHIGLYGVSIGGYASLVAASQDPTVKAVVVDAVYPDVHRFLKIKVHDFANFSDPFTDYFTDLGMKFYLSGKYGSTSAVKAIHKYSDVKQLYIMGKDAGDLLTTTTELYNQASPPKESAEVPHSRIRVLYKNDQDVYDPVVVEFFHRADVLPPNTAAPAANGAQTPAAGAPATGSPTTAAPAPATTAAPAKK